MNVTCTTIQERLPELAAGRLQASERGPVDEHLAGCAECREVFETLTLLAAAPPPVPAGLEERIRVAARAELVRSSGGSDGASAAHASPPKARGRGGWLAPAWGLAAAATVALLLGRTLTGGPEAPELDLLAMSGDDVQLMLPDDGMVAGAPVLDDLSDEDLALLLEQMER